MRARLAMALHLELSGMHLGVTIHSPKHGKHVSLWIQRHRDGHALVDAILPIEDYRLLFRDAYTDDSEAIEAWRAAYLDLFDVDPLL